ncbi:MAG: hypothetical protein M5R36_28250 [Deltaproteobacteria bacterium]|nr:hypothetical protein [Deltaproteobacteria bacterium]
MTAVPYSEMKRKVEHIAPLGFAFTLTIFPKWLVFTLSVTSIVYGIFISKRVVKGTLRQGELDRGFSLGKAAYGIMILLLLILFHHRMHVVAGAWALLALGDGSASIFGTLYGGTKLPWNDEKSPAGLIGFVVVGTLACFLLPFGISRRPATWASRSTRRSRPRRSRACSAPRPSVAWRARRRKRFRSRWTTTFSCPRSAACFCTY